MIKQDEIEIVIWILNNLKENPLDNSIVMLPFPDYPFNWRRLETILNKWSGREWINWGVSVFSGWLEVSHNVIIEWYKKQGVDIQC